MKTEKVIEEPEVVARARRAPVLNYMPESRMTVPVHRGQVFLNPKSIYDACADIREDEQENFVCFELGPSGGLISRRLVSRGDRGEVLSIPRDVFRMAIRDDAFVIVLVHNHPGGDSTPSDADFNVHKRMTEVGNIIGIPVLDSIVVSSGGWSSMAKELEKKEKEEMPKDMSEMLAGLKKLLGPMMVIGGPMNMPPEDNPFSDKPPEDKKKNGPN